MDIQIVQPTVAAHIAAGEVVEHPASFVKELVENAIDAGATQITVSIEQGGTKSIRVQDNGSGIPADQVVTAFSKHATSKLRTARRSALHRHPRLPRRGPALDCRRLNPDLRDLHRRRRLVLPHQVRRARRHSAPHQRRRRHRGHSRKSLRQPARSAQVPAHETHRTGQVQRVVARYAVAYPHVRFQYVNEGNEPCRSNSTGKLSETIPSIIGHDVASKILPVLLHTDDANVQGYVGITDLHRSNRNDISVSADGH